MYISSDIGGYIFGKIFKGKKLTKISPNKTYSGLIGSYIFIINNNFIFFLIIILNMKYYLIFIFISSISQLGDLFISLFKKKSKN